MFNQQFNFRIFNLVAILGLTFVLSCGGGGNKGGDGGNVYVAGTVNGYATLWKNGIPAQLSAVDSKASSVFVSGNGDVYVAGYTGVDYYYDTCRAMLWKNGIPTQLSAINSIANSVFVSGNDVYVAGYDYDYGAVLWKNGTQVVLNSTSSSYSAEACSVFVSGNGDVYAAGSEWRKSNGTSFPILWKNGILTRLSSNYLNGADYRAASSVFVSGNDVYVAGIGISDSSYSKSPFRATLWKNGIPTQLSANHSDAYSVFVSGNDVYVAGSELDGRATLWKNGIPTFLSSNNAYTLSVFVK